MLKTLMLSALLSPEPEMARARDNPKVRNFAISATVIVAANLLLFAPMIASSMTQES